MKKGFTLIEMMTAVSIFLVVMTISMGAILGVFDANKKSESLKTVMDNLNLAVESMSREMRFGSQYHCEESPDPGLILGVKNCATGGKLVYFVSSEGLHITYRVYNHAIEKRTGDDGVFVAVTAPEIVINDDTGFNFYVTGAEPVSDGDLLQPKVLIKISGKAGSSANLTDFSVQTLVSQRTLDNS